MSPSTVFLISGANRGIGFKFVEELSARPNTIIYAGVRSFPLGAENQLALLAAKLPERVFPVKLTSASEEDNQAAARFIKDKVGKVDVIIANAGASTGKTPMNSVKPAQMQADFNVNTIGPVVLYQAFADLLSASDAPGGAKFVIISSILGQLSGNLPYMHNAYGISKAGANFIAKKMDQELPEIICFSIHPGQVDTDLGRSGAASLGLTIEQIGAISQRASVTGMLGVIDIATKEKHGGKFWSYTGKELKY